MTDLSTSNDFSHKSHHSQPLQNSPRHHYHLPQNSPQQHFANFNNKQFTNKSSAHIINHNNKHNNQQKGFPLTPTASAPASAAQSPQHYRNPFNSPNNSPYTHAPGYNGDSRRCKIPLQQQLNELFLQQQQQQQQQQQVKKEGDELSEESLKQNVAIVLSNLDRYNNALRSIILNEQQVVDNDENYPDNNNFLVSKNNKKMATAATEADFNSNATPSQHHNNMVGFAIGANVGGPAAAAAAALGGGVNGGGVLPGICGNALNCSLASSHDFTHDNSDYQWFLDYGYRDGLQRSVLSSLSASYNGIGDLIYYEDLAKNLDANLAEVDMESFRAEDIHSLLSHLPSYCKNLNSGQNHHLQESSLIMQQQHLLPHGAQYANNIMSQMSNNSTNDMIDNSICKSELLFSPVKESHISIDSLDMDAYPDDGDIILTCKANKDNYTIAFEGSMMYSDDSFYEPTEIALRNKQNCINGDETIKQRTMEMSISHSEQALSNRSKLYKDNLMQLQRYPSGNNNNTINNNNNTSDTITITRQLSHCLVRKSNSLPNLCQQGSVLDEAFALTGSTVDSSKFRTLLPMCQIPISTCNSNSASIVGRLTTKVQQQQQQQQQQQSQQKARHKHRCSCSNSSSSGTAAVTSPTANPQTPSQTHTHAHISGSTSSGNSNPPAFNLVKLFIKQKSSNCSSEEQMSSQTCMDVSSGCWPSSDAAGSSSSSSLEQRLRKKSMNDSGKGSALSRHDEEEDAGDESAFINECHKDHSTPKRHIRSRNDAAFYDDDRSTSSSGSLTVTASAAPTVTNSPAHWRRSMPLRHPQLSNLLMQHNNGIGSAYGGSQLSSEASRSNSDPVTQVYLSSSGEKQRQGDLSRRTSTASSSEMVTRSIQTSFGSLSTSRSSLSDRFRCVPPSFLAQLSKLGEERQAPIYVVYPNYALPDLGFVQTTSSASPEVILSPFNYKMSVSSAISMTTSLGLSNMAAMKKDISLTDGDILNSLDFKHVIDWQSLATLLPAEYRRRLKHIPEVTELMCNLDTELAQRPLFCMAPPVRRQQARICDCAKYFQKWVEKQESEEGVTSNSSSSQQPSSGYRGSSTLLNDSEMVDNAGALKQMYVYQYEQPRLDSGVEMSPVVSHRMGSQPQPQPQPHPMPRGILRKTQSQTGRVKRNSMIEDPQSKLSKQEKRRSLQEPPYQRTPPGSSEELAGVYEEEKDDLYAVPQSRKERLSRKELDARIRAENFLSSLPRSELKHYAEIAAILESESCENQVHYDPAALKKEVSRVLSQQKKVSFNDKQQANDKVKTFAAAPAVREAHFTTPPNSPNISLAHGGRHAYGAPRRGLQLNEKDDKERKIESNRFKRLQIQWELMSKDSNMLKDLAQADHTKSGGSTPTSATANRSRIPRPVSYPAGKIKTAQKSASESNVTRKRIANKESIKRFCVSPSPSSSRLPFSRPARISTQESNAKVTARSPSRILPPKRYSMTSSPVTKPRTTPSPTIAQTPSPTAATTTPPSRARTPNSRVAVTAPNTPKRSLPSPRTIPRVR